MLPLLSMMWLGKPTSGYFRSESFENTGDWANEIKNNTDDDVLMYLVGNWVDMEDERDVSTEQG